MGKTLSDVHESDVAQAIEQALIERREDHESEFHTVKELADLTEMTNHDKIREALHALNEAGRLEIGTKVKQNLAGVMQPRPAYKILSNGQSPEGESNE